MRLTIGRAVSPCGFFDLESYVVIVVLFTAVPQKAQNLSPAEEVFAGFL